MNGTTPYSAALPLARTIAPVLPSRTDPNRWIRPTISLAQDETGLNLAEMENDWGKTVMQRGGAGKPITGD